VLLLSVAACGHRDDAPPPPPQPRPQPIVADAAIVSDYRDARVEPAITSIAPELGPVGQWVYVTGTGFTRDAKVELGDVAVTGVEVYAANQLGFTVPPGVSGTHPVHVTLGAMRLTSAAQFTVGVPHGRPAISSFSPAEGAPGAYVYVYGDNFVFGATTVLLGDAHAVGNVFTPGSLAFTVPATAHDAQLIVRTPNGDARSDGGFRVLAVRRAEPVR
jgi:hypothetical protein